jgi:hypothetical protein
MKFNKWTLGLAAIGAVSLASAARADETKITPLQTALSNTTISGYVDVAAQYNTGSQNNNVNENGVPAGTSASKMDQFSLNNVTVSIDRPQDESPWAAGYHVDLNWGQDAISGASSAVSGFESGAVATSAASEFGVRQAYVVIRTPLGNGIDWKVGVQDDIIGYEGNTDGLNPNYTRSIGYYVEPTTLTGLIGTYKFSDMLSVSGGIANATDATFEDARALSSKTFAAAAAFTAPDSWGFLKGGTANIGTLLNLENGGQNNFYAGLTIPTPCSKLKVGSSFDLVSLADQNTYGNNHNSSGWVVGVYGNFQATDKLSLNLRGEYFDMPFAGFTAYPDGNGNGKGEELTATVQYNLWANVISRAEVRWDHSDSGTTFGSDSSQANSFILALNLIYTF